MDKTLRSISFWFFTISIFLFLPETTQAKEKGPNLKVRPIVVKDFLAEAKDNDNWKVAFITGEHEQIVFMNISPNTNPENEIGNETHLFDQVILIVEGRGKTLISGDTSLVEEGDIIFIPKGTEHNVMNLGLEKPLKIASFYSDTDIPKGAIYRRKTDEPVEK